MGGGINLDIPTAPDVASVEATLVASPPPAHVLEEMTVDRTQPFNRERIFTEPTDVLAKVPMLAAAWRPTKLPDIEVPVESTLAVRPPSVPPLSIDITPTAPPTPPKQSNLVAALAGGLVALSAAAVVAAVVFFATSTSVLGASSRSPSASEPRKLDHDSARGAVIETPSLAASRTERAPKSVDVEPSLVPDRESSPQESKLPEPNPALLAALAPPPPEPEPADTTPLPTPPAPPPTTGIIQVPPSLMTVMIDGDYKRASTGRVVVTCGRHRVSVGRGMESVDVPCGSSVTIR